MFSNSVLKINSDDDFWNNTIIIKEYKLIVIINAFTTEYLQGKLLLS